MQTRSSLMKILIATTWVGLMPTAALAQSAIAGLASVTFTLPGFNTIKREAVELPTNFTATINADLRVGSLEETVTVSGLSPVVDVQNAVQQTVLTRLPKVADH